MRFSYKIIYVEYLCIHKNMDYSVLILKQMSFVDMEKNSLFVQLLFILQMKLYPSVCSVELLPVLWEVSYQTPQMCSRLVSVTPHRDVLM